MTTSRLDPGDAGGDVNLGVIRERMAVLAKIDGDQLLFERFDFFA